jgi:hypothetical protein
MKTLFFNFGQIARYFGWTQNSILKGLSCSRGQNQSRVGNSGTTVLYFASEQNVLLHKLNFTSWIPLQSWGIISSWMWFCIIGRWVLDVVTQGSTCLRRMTESETKTLSRKVRNPIPRDVALYFCITDTSSTQMRKLHRIIRFCGTQCE